MTYLLDVNVLIALIDPKHVHNNAVLTWFTGEARDSWASCPLTQNGAVRIVSGSGYPNRPGSPAVVMETLAALCDLDGHSFWADDLSLLDPRHVAANAVASASQITDTYLLALAVAKNAKLATLDRRLSPVAVPGGANAIRLIEVAE